MRCLIVDMVKSKIYAKSPCLCVCVCLCSSVWKKLQCYNKILSKVMHPFYHLFPPTILLCLISVIYCRFLCQVKIQLFKPPFQSLSLSFLYFLSPFLDALLSLVSCRLVASYKLICPTLYCLVNYLHSVVKHV